MINGIKIFFILFTSCTRLIEVPVSKTARVRLRAQGNVGKQTGINPGLPIRSIRNLLHLLPKDHAYSECNVLCDKEV